MKTTPKQLKRYISDIDDIVMADFDFYTAKAYQLRQHVKWIKQSLGKTSDRHKEITRWMRERCTQFDAKLALMGKIIRHGNTAYLPRLRTDHMLLEKHIMCVSNYMGIMLREGDYEKKFSNVIRCFCGESGFAVKDFLVGFTTILDGPGISTGEATNPIFYVRDESLASAYSWIALFHEMGHIAVRFDRDKIIKPLARIVIDHFRQARTAIGPVKPGARESTEAALDAAERYWLAGINDIRLEELFCDCFAIYTAGLAYLYFWLDYGVGFEEKPKFIDLCDEHPPFSARFEACWHATPERLRNSEYGLRLERIWNNYMSSTSGTNNPELLYGTACPRELLHRLADASVLLIEHNWPSMHRWDKPPSQGAVDSSINKPLAALLNNLVATLIRSCEDYEKSERRILETVLDTK